MGNLLVRSVLTATASIAASAVALPAAAQSVGQGYDLNIPAQSLGDALRSFGRATRQNVIFDGASVRGKRSMAVRGRYTAREALDRMLAGSGLSVSTGAGGVMMVRPGNGSAEASASQDSSPRDGTMRLGEAGIGSAPPDNEGAEIVVTGTNIRNLAPGSSPVDVITRADINRSGLTSTADVIRTLPSNFGGGLGVTTRASGSLTQHAGDNRGFATGANLRGLGSDSTLTLLNGNRLPIASEGYSVDVSMIPLEIVDRVEALKDGASSIYGSDAVAGVVNIITKTRFDGLATSATIGGVTKGDKTDIQLSQLAGTTWGSGGIMAAFTYDRQDSLSTASKPISRDATDPSQLSPDIDSYSIYAAADQELSDGLKLTANLLWNKRHIRSANAFLVGPDIAISESRSRTMGLLGTAGLSYETGGWNIDLTGTYSRSKTAYHVLPNLVSDAFRQRIAGRNVSVEAKASGPLAELPGGTLQMAIGGMYRHEKFGVVDGYDLSRNIEAVYGELFVPLVSAINALPGIRRLEVTGSIRHEHYSDFGSTTNPKVGLLWAPVDALRIRGSFSTSFRAPLLAELQQTDASNFLLELPDPLSPTESSLTIYRIGGNPDLRPATARTFNIGAGLAPQGSGFSLEIDYFNVRFKNRIDQPGGGAVLIETEPDLYGAFLIRNPTADQVTALTDSPGFLNFYGPFVPSDVQLIADARRTNLTAVFVDGIDGRASYAMETDAGAFTGSIDASYLLHYRETLVPGAAAISRRNTPYYPAAFRSRVGLSWEKAGWSTSAFANYVGKYRDNRIANSPRSVNDWLTVDFQIAYRPKVDFLRSTSISLSVQNLFDRAPPFVRNDNLIDSPNYGQNYDASNASALGRYVSLRLSTEW
jgi:outer membrane receptor protein involved in Fe transport